MIKIIKIMKDVLRMSWYFSHSKLVLHVFHNSMYNTSILHGAIIGKTHFYSSRAMNENARPYYIKKNIFTVLCHIIYEEQIQF